jgi:hypothetical protein
MVEGTEILTERTPRARLTQDALFPMMKNQPSPLVL